MGSGNTKARSYRDVSGAPPAADTDTAAQDAMASFAPHDWTAALGPQLQTKQGLKPTAEALKAEVVGLYFSAHW